MACRYAANEVSIADFMQRTKAMRTDFFLQWNRVSCTDLLQWNKARRIWTSYSGTQEDLRAYCSGTQRGISTSCSGTERCVPIFFAAKGTTDFANPAAIVIAACELHKLCMEHQVYDSTVLFYVGGYIEVN